MPIEDQIIFVNDRLANNEDFLSEKLTATASNCIAKDIQIRARLFIVTKQSHVDKNTDMIWTCEVCSFNNKASKCSSCHMCKTDQSPQGKESRYMALYNLALNLASEPFDCDICLEQQISPKQGVLLKDCLHLFCKECLRNHVNFNPDPVLVQCPYTKEYNFQQTGQRDQGSSERAGEASNKKSSTVRGQYEELCSLQVS